METKTLKRITAILGVIITLVVVGGYIRNLILFPNRVLDRITALEAARLVQAEKQKELETIASDVRDIKRAIVGDSYGVPGLVKRLEATEAWIRADELKKMVR